MIYSQLFSTRVLTAQNLLLGIISGSCSDKLFAQLDLSIQRGIDSMVRSERVARMVLGSQEYTSMKKRVCELIRADIRVFIQHLTPYLDEAFDVQATLEMAMRNLSSEEFAGMIMPIFTEGETKLVMIGGILGVLVGLAQAFAQVAWLDQIDV